MALLYCDPDSSVGKVTGRPEFVSRQCKGFKRFILKMTGSSFSKSWANKPTTIWCQNPRMERILFTAIRRRYSYDKEKALSLDDNLNNEGQ